MLTTWKINKSTTVEYLIKFLQIFQIVTLYNFNFKNYNYFSYLKFFLFSYSSNLLNNNIFFLKNKTNTQNFFNNYLDSNTFFYQKNNNLSCSNIFFLNNSKNIFFLNNSKNIYFKKKFNYLILNFFFSNSFISNKTSYQITGFFKFFSFKNINSTSIIFNLNKILSQWVDFFNFTINIYFYKIQTLFFSSPFFKNETLSLNWNLNDYFQFNFWKQIYFYFVFKTNRISSESNFFFKKLKKHNQFLFVISDCLYHYKNIYYLKKNNFFLLGLTTTTTNPWLVNYPILVSSNSYLNQIFFFQSFFLSQKKSFFLNFLFFKKIWFSLYLTKHILLK